MRHWVALIAAILFAAGCGGDSKPGAPTQEAAQPPAEPTATLTQEDTEFCFYDFSARPTDGSPQKPTFRMWAPTITMDADGVATFTDANAEIHGRNGEITEVDASKGRFDNEAKTAIMEGEVVVRTGDMRIELSELTWLNEERTAKSDKPIRLIDRGTVLEASSLVFLPDEKKLLLSDVTGKISPRGEQEQ